jgi:hypothetical protein
MKLVVPGFSLRTPAEVATDEMAATVSTVLGCTLQPGDYHGEPVYRATLLGMVVLLTAWPGKDRKLMFQLHGFVENATFADSDVVDLSDVVRSLLLSKTARDWYQPTAADLDAEVTEQERRLREP